MAFNPRIREIEWVLNEIESDNLCMNSISFHHFRTSNSCYQETEASLAICLSANRESNLSFSQILAALATGIKINNSLKILEFHEVHWSLQEKRILCSWLEKNVSVKRIVFQHNNFGDENLSEFSEMLKRNTGMKELIFMESGIGQVGVGSLAHALRRNQHIEELQIWGDSIGSKGAEDICQMIEFNAILKLLLILDSQAITAAPLVSSVLSRNRPMELHIWHSTSKDKNQKVVELVPEMNTLRVYTLDMQGACRVTCALGWNSTITSLDMSGIRLRSRWAKEFRSVLEQNQSLKQVNLSRTKLRNKAVVYIAAGLFKNRCLERLQLEGNLFTGIGVEHLLCPLSRFSVCQNQANSTLTSLSFGSIDARINRGGMEAIVRMLLTNQSITQLGIHRNRNLKSEDFIRIFVALKANSTLRHLSLCGCQGVEGDELMQSMMHTLQVNPWIEDIDLTGTPLEISGKAECVYKKLRQSETMVLPEVDLLNDMPRRKPKCCRVFICGQERSGKSSLSYTLTQIFYSTKRQYYDHMKHLINPINHGTRAGGIKIRSLKFDDETKVSIWNLCGQEFHVLHELMFPEPGSPAFFLIVLSVCQKTTDREPKKVHDIQEEIRYWLRFIVSNTKRTKLKPMLPNVTIVFTHFDKLVQPTDHLKQTAICINKLREHFHGYVELYPTIFAVDTRSSGSVSKLACHMRKTSKAIQDRVPDVYELCHEVERNLQEWKIENSNKPVMKWKEFCYLCQAKIQELSIRSRRANIEKVDARRRIILCSLQHLGELIYFQELGLLVLDCEWFCRDIIGLLVRMKQHNDVQGFISRNELEKLLGECLKGRTLGTDLRTFDNVSTTDLIEMMIKLELCYEQDPQAQNSVFLVPMLLDGKQVKSHKWQEGAPDCTYAGRRFECDDASHMFLTPGFFARLQVHLHNKIVGTNRRHTASYTLQKNLILINIDGVEIRVEYLGELEQHQLDILSHSNKNVSETLKLIHHLIVPSVMALCHGVTLVESVLRPQCVKELRPPRERMTQHISLQQLKNTLLSLPADEMYNYQHSWPSLLEGSRTIIHSGFDYARNLLSDDDLFEVLQRRYYDLHCLAAELAVTPDGNSHGPSCDNAFDTASNNVEPTISGIAKGVELVLQRLKFIEKQLKDIKKEIQELRYYEYTLLNGLHQKINRLLNFSLQLEERRIPHLFYFVHSTRSYPRRLVTSLVSGLTPLRLHMLCEMRGEIHVVENQSGCEVMRVDNRTVQCLAPYMNRFMKLLVLALKVGAHFAVGLGEMIPDMSKEFSRLIDSSFMYGATMMAAGALVMEGRKTDRRSTGLRGKSRDVYGDEVRVAQQWLNDFLKDQKCFSGKDIAEKFLLWRVRYLDDGQIAWVCRRHRAARANEFTELPT